MCVVLTGTHEDVKRGFCALQAGPERGDTRARDDLSGHDVETIMVIMKAVSVSELKAFNKLSSHILAVGMVIQIP